MTDESVSRDAFQDDDGFNDTPQTSAVPATAATMDSYLLVSPGAATGTTRAILWDSTPSLAALYQNGITETLWVFDGNNFGDTGLSLPNATSTAFLVRISSGRVDVQIGNGRTLTQVFWMENTPPHALDGFSPLPIRKDGSSSQPSLTGWFGEVRLTHQHRADKNMLLAALETAAAPI
ncbi:MAG: hypothetical protein AAGI03_06880 [Pseudomonadota bacterium]